MSLTRKDLGVFGQMMTHVLFAMWNTANATTGISKTRRMQQGVKGGGWRDLTDEEKIKDSLECAHRHIEHVNNFADYFLSERD